MSVKECMEIEWKIMRSISKHGITLVSQILEDLEDEDYATTEIVEAIVRLIQARIIHFVQRHRYFDFGPASESKLTEDVAKFSKPTISFDEYKKFGWTILGEVWE